MSIFNRAKKLMGETADDLREADKDLTEIAKYFQSERGKEKLGGRFVTFAEEGKETLAYFGEKGYELWRWELQARVDRDKQIRKLKELYETVSSVIIFSDTTEEQPKVDINLWKQAVAAIEAWENTE